jgi:hypothetical protein
MRQRDVLCMLCSVAITITASRRPHTDALHTVVAKCPIQKECYPLPFALEGRAWPDGVRWAINPHDPLLFSLVIQLSPPPLPLCADLG